MGGHTNAAGAKTFLIFKGCEKIDQYDPQALAELLLEQSNPDWREKIHKTYYDSKKELEQQTIYSLSSG